MNTNSYKNVTIIGGGLAGLTASIILSKKGFAVSLIEKKKYPFHRVCGEYVSNEVLPFLSTLGFNPQLQGCSSISKFLLSTPDGKSRSITLNLGGFGLSRYQFDNALYKIAIECGVRLIHDKVERIHSSDTKHEINLKNYGEEETDLLIGAYGKRSEIDVQLDRNFIKRRSPYMGVKYHIKTDFDKQTVALHNFDGGYCGINAIEDGRYNLCYLTKRSNVKKNRSIEAMENNVLRKNPYIANILKNSDFLFEKPLVINEISFETKTPVNNHILMCGDSAGMIAPLCGNGMAMAIRSAKILSDCIIEARDENRERSQLERAYSHAWNQEFKIRLQVGRTIQRLFGHGRLSGFAVSALNSPSIANFIINQTHGKPFA